VGRPFPFSVAWFLHFDWRYKGRPGVRVDGGEAEGLRGGVEVADCFGGGDRVGRINLPSGYGIEDYDLEFFLGKGRAIKSLIYIFCLILLSGMQP
jgi:hypothetical protein